MMFGSEGIMMLDPLTAGWETSRGVRRVSLREGARHLRSCGIGPASQGGIMVIDPE